EPILGQIPNVVKSRNETGLPLLREDEERFSYAEAFRSLRSSLIFMPNQSELKSILITSAIPNEGKSTIASTLAVTMAASGARVLLVDADLRGANLQGAILKSASLQNSCLCRADLRNANLSEADLSGAKLQVAVYDSLTVWPSGFRYKNCGAVGPGAILSGAFLNTADLRFVDLSGANLLGAYLSGADLTGANLQGARLSGANLRRAFLTGACLRDAGLNGAELNGVDFRGADFTGVSLDHVTSIEGADFNGVRGLSEALRAMLCHRSSAELDSWNSLTRTTTRESLNCEGV
ncbi:MAG: pentapeptide repeat-containing protein, partial [Microcoleus sp.]